MDLIRIDDFHASQLEIYARLNENQLYRINEPHPGLFIAESAKVIRRAIDAGYEPVSFLVEERFLRNTETDDPAYLEVQDILPKDGTPVYTAGLPVLEQITGYRLTRGVLAAMRRKPQSLPERLPDWFKKICVLDRVMNPTNLGAIVRSAAALGMDAIIFSNDSADPLYRRAVRVSMGCIFQIPWMVAPDTRALIAKLKNQGFVTCAMALKEDSISVGDPVLKQAERLAVVLGSEGDGLPDETVSACDYTVKIPMSHGVDSLNVAAAAAVVFWELSGSTF